MVNSAYRHLYICNPLYLSVGVRGVRMYVYTLPQNDAYSWRRRSAAAFLAPAAMQGCVNVRLAVRVDCVW